MWGWRLELLREKTNRENSILIYSFVSILSSTDGAFRFHMFMLRIFCVRIIPAQFAMFPLPDCDQHPHTLVYALVCCARNSHRADSCCTGRVQRGWEIVTQTVLFQSLSSLKSEIYFKIMRRGVTFVNTTETERIVCEGLWIRTLYHLSVRQSNRFNFNTTHLWRTSFMKT